MRMNAAIEQGLMTRITGRGLALLLLLVMSAGMQPSLGQEVPDAGISEAEQAAFTRGQTLYNQGMYGEAILTLNEFLARYPSSTIKDLGLLWLGRSYLAQGDIANAEKIGLRLKDIPDTPLAALYEDDLRLERQSFAKAAAPKHAAKREVSRSQAESKAPEQMKRKESELLAVTPMTKAPEKLNPSVEQVAPKVDAPVVRLPVAVKAPTAAIPKLESPKPNQVAASLKPAAIGENKTPKAVQPIAIAPARSSAGPSVKIQASSNGSPLLRSRFETGSASGAFRLLMVNDGDGRATDLTVRIEIDPFVSYVNSDLMPIRQEMIGQRQVLTFRVPAVEAGETKAIQLTVRSLANSSRSVTPFKHSIFYKDSQGRFLHTP